MNKSVSQIDPSKYRVLIAGMYLVGDLSNVVATIRLFQLKYNRSPNNMEILHITEIESLAKLQSVLLQLQRLKIMEWSYHPERVIRFLVEVKLVPLVPKNKADMKHDVADN